MQRKLIDSLFNHIHISFQALLTTAATFRPHDIDEMIGAGLTADEAAVIYDAHTQRIRAFLEKLAEFSQTTKEELTVSEVNLCIRAVNLRISNTTNAKVSKEDCPRKQHAWQQTIMYQTSIPHTSKCCLRNITQFLQQNNIFPDLRSFLEVNGFAGFYSLNKASNKNRIVPSINNTPPTLRQ
jgi:hypothetical protein